MLSSGCTLLAMLKTLQLIDDLIILPVTAKVLSVLLQCSNITAPCYGSFFMVLHATTMAGSIYIFCVGKLRPQRHS